MLSLMMAINTMVNKMICWKCKESIQGAICVSCSTLQPPVNVSYFSLFEIEPKYFLNPENIEQKYRQLSRKLHPDRWRKKSAVERRFSLQWTALVNEARKTLLDPILRGRYIATGTAKVAETSTISQDFLEKIFSLQMDAMDAPQKVLIETQQLQEKNTKQLEQVFYDWENNNGSLDQVEELLGRWKYITNLLQKLEG